ncbi:MAG: hypothetical protein WC351_00510 [Candidatus Izemoplasmatales bacterium]|jgi:phosphotransferase system IIB component
MFGQLTGLMLGFFHYMLGVLIIIGVVYVVILILRSRKKKVSHIPEERIDQLIAILGGIDNISGFQPTGSRLKFELVHIKKCDFEDLKSFGANGIFVSGKFVKFMLSPHADLYANEIQKRMKEHAS